MAETITKEGASSTSAADEAVRLSAEASAKAAADAAAKTAQNIAAVKPDFAAEEARIAALPEAERAAAQAKLDTEKKAATDAAGTKVVPEKYDLKIPEGSGLDVAFVERTAAIARELGLDQKGAETLLTHRAQEVASVMAAYKAPDLKTGLGAGPAWIARDEAFAKDAFADKDFGKGDQATFDTAKEKAQQGLKVLDPTGSLHQLLNESGWGSHPTVLKALAGLGRRAGEGASIAGAAGASAAKKTEAQIMYPSMYNEDGTPKVAG